MGKHQGMLYFQVAVDARKSLFSSRRRWEMRRYEEESFVTFAKPSQKRDAEYFRIEFVKSYLWEV